MVGTNLLQYLRHLFQNYMEECISHIKVVLMLFFHSYVEAKKLTSQPNSTFKEHHIHFYSFLRHHWAQVIHFQVCSMGLIKPGNRYIYYTFTTYISIYKMQWSERLTKSIYPLVVKITNILNCNNMFTSSYKHFLVFLNFVHKKRSGGKRGFKNK